jgi:hypothetical protein
MHGQSWVDERCMESSVARVGKRLEGTAAGLDCVGVFFLRLGAGFLGNQTHGNVMA